MILIDEEKAIKMGGGVVAKILTACTIPVPESAEACAREILNDFTGCDYFTNGDDKECIANNIELPSRLIQSYADRQVEQQKGSGG